MAKIIGGIATTHVPSIGNAIAHKKQIDPYWKPFFQGFDYVRDACSLQLSHPHFQHRRGNDRAGQ